MIDDSEHHFSFAVPWLGKHERLPSRESNRHSQASPPTIETNLLDSMAWTSRNCAKLATGTAFVGFPATPTTKRHCALVYFHFVSATWLGRAQTPTGDKRSGGGSLIKPSPTTSLWFTLNSVLPSSTMASSTPKTVPNSPFFQPSTPHVIVVQQTPGGTRRPLSIKEEVKEHKSGIIGCTANLMNAIGTLDGTSLQIWSDAW